MNAQGSYDHCSELILTISGSPSVGDLFSSTRDGHTSFHLPDTPHFRHFYDFTGPCDYDIFYETNHGKITLAGFMRFIEQGHTLFQNEYARRSYKKSLASALYRHKNFKAFPSKKTFKDLRLAQDQVLQYLYRLSLRNVETRKALETILSTPPSTVWSKLTQALTWWILPGRTSKETDAHNNPSKIHLSLHSSPLGSLLTKTMFNLACRYAFGRGSLSLSKTQFFPIYVFSLFSVFFHFFQSLPVVAVLIAAHSFDVCFFLLDINEIFPVFTTSNIVNTIASCTNFRLSPEPPGGVKISIRFQQSIFLLPETSAIRTNHDFFTHTGNVLFYDDRKKHIKAPVLSLTQKKHTWP